MDGERRQVVVAVDGQATPVDQEAGLGQAGRIAGPARAAAPAVARAARSDYAVAEGITGLSGASYEGGSN